MSDFSADIERAVLVVFDACRVTGANLSMSHQVAALVAEHLERIEADRLAADAIHGDDS